MGIFGLNIAKLQTQNDIDGLIKAIGNRRIRTALAAVKAVEEIGGPRALAALVGCHRVSRDGTFPKELSAEIRAAALEAIRRLGDVDGLLRLLDAGDASLQRGAAFVLGELAERRAMMPLLSLLANTNASDPSRVVAAVALGRLGDPQCIRPLLQYFVERVRVFDMKGFRPNRILVDGLMDKAFVNEVKSIKGFGSAAVGTLREMLDQESDEKVQMFLESAIQRAEARGTFVTLWAPDEQTARRLITDGDFSIAAVGREKTDAAKAFLAAVAAASIGEHVFGTIKANATRGGFDVTLCVGEKKESGQGQDGEVIRVNRRV